MPVRKEDAHRALLLLEEYHGKLSRPEDQLLKNSVEQVIKIFKNSLFQALLDIQEFYEATLMNESKSTQQKTREAQQMSNKFQNQLAFYAGDKQQRGGDGGSSVTAATSQLTSANTNGGLISMDDLLASPALSSKPSAGFHHQRNGFGGAAGERDDHSSVNSPKNARPSQSSIPSQSGVTAGAAGFRRTSNHSSSSSYGATAADADPASPKQTSGSDFESQEIILERGTTGLGFSIAGGNDNPTTENDPSIYVSKIVEGGAAHLDGRMRLGDIVTQINDDQVVDVDHQIAVDALRRAGNIVQLRLKRRKPNVFTLTIVKGNRGLGISVGGGLHNQHIPDDNGIFITKIVEGGAAFLDGRLRVGDKILLVGDTELTDCQHDFAVSVLKSTGDVVTLVVERAAVLEIPEGAISSASPVSGHSFVLDHDMVSRGSPAYHRGNSFSYDSPGQRARSVPPTRYDLDPYKAPMAALEDEQELKEPRSVPLVKGPGGLGFNIVGGEEGEGIFISYIVPGGSCDLNGNLRRGDRIISVNGINVYHASHEEAAEALKGTGNNVTIVAQYRPDEYQKFEDKIQEIKEKIMSASTNSLRPALKRSLHVRALFDYDPSKDSGLPSRGLAFCFGDILHVTNASDDEWWQAKRVSATGVEEGLGIIPSKLRVEKKERARLKSVKFEANDTNKSASTSTLDRLTGRVKKEKDTTSTSSGKHSATINGKKFGFFKGNKEQSGDETSESEKPEDLILSYEPVSLERLKFVRPVIIMGPLKDRINDDLIAEYPDRFASCVPHTTRPRRDHEINGRDYHFVDSREQMEHDIQNHLFIEAGQYTDNLYGTSVAAVLAVVKDGKHCILDVSGAAVRRLHSNNLYPIVVYVKPKSVDSILEMNRRMTEEMAQKSLDRCAKLEKEFGHYFTAVVSGDTPEEIYSRVKEVVYSESGEKSWIPSKERL
ncbi:Disks large-like protein 2 [Hypsibius exemplaris]|uniref:Disks large-like protein 2 n=1 Tax=Hypsibius exemplaris TaxID=2072580 RepID=A0A1W0WKY9_HYPEX|nr:Disks large-like protein 2 [Hypsibius exemplaris]